MALFNFFFRHKYKLGDLSIIQKNERSVTCVQLFINLRVSLGRAKVVVLVDNKYNNEKM